MNLQKLVTQIAGFYSRMKPGTRRIAVYATAVTVLIIFASITTVAFESINGGAGGMSRKRTPPPEKSILTGRGTDSLRVEEAAAQAKKQEEFMRKLLAGEIDPENLRPTDIPPGMEDAVRQMLAKQEKSKGSKIDVEEAFRDLPEMDMPTPKSVAEISESGDVMLPPNVVPPPKQKNTRLNEAMVMRGEPTAKDRMNGDGTVGVGSPLGGDPAYPESGMMPSGPSGQTGGGRNGAPPVAIRSIDSSNSGEGAVEMADAQGEGAVAEQYKNRTQQEVTVKGPTGVIRSTEDVSRRMKREVEEEKNTVYIPAGSIVSGVLISGMEAYTSNQARRDPFPTLIRINKEALLPNRFRMDVRQCFLLAEGFGDLSSERVVLRSTTISCVRQDGGVIEAPFRAFAVGEDGLAGVRGELITRNGQLIANSLLAGLASGLSSAFKPAKVPSLNLNPGSDSTFETVTAKDGLRQSALGGVNTSTERIADYFLEMAKNIFPVIKINPGRNIDFVITKGIELEALRGSRGNQNQIQSARRGR